MSTESNSPEGYPTDDDIVMQDAEPVHRVPSIDPEVCKAAGNKYFRVKDYLGAIAEYTKALSVEPQSVTYLSNRAAAYTSANNYELALEDCKTADRIEPSNAKVIHRIARIYTSLGRPTEALDALDILDRILVLQAVSPQDRSPTMSMQTHIKQAEDAIREGTTESMAIHALDQAERGLGIGVQKPRKWQLLRGEAYLKMGNVDALGEAMNVAMSLLQRNNQDPEALILRGRALYGQGDEEKALQHFRQALSCDPDFKDGLKYLRMVQHRMKEQGNAAFKEGRYEQAVEVYSQALDVDSNNKGTNSKILQNRALASLKLKDYKSAISDCTRAYHLDPSYTKARKTMFRAFGESGDWEAAVREYKAIQESTPDEPNIDKYIHSAELELRKSRREDYYKILGVEKDATENVIKKAYRKSAIMLHPDKNPEDKEAAGRFKVIGEAYETLMDPEKKAQYDKKLINPSNMSAQKDGGFPMGASQERGGGGGFPFNTGGMPFGASSGGSSTHFQKGYQARNKARKQPWNARYRR